jgi:glucose/arabinose dehydrogenase
MALDHARNRRPWVIAVLGLLLGLATDARADSQGADAASAVLTGKRAFGDWHADRPGVRRHITVGDLPPPLATASAGNSPGVIDRRRGMTPRAPEGFKVALFADGLDAPRAMRTAPNGDVFLAETAAGRIRILRASPGAVRADVNVVFARDLEGPFGIAFYPARPDPRWVYVAERNVVRRFPYRSGDLQARGPSEIIIPRLARTTGGHTTRDLAFSPDGSRLFVSVGSASNVAEELSPRGPQEVRAWQQEHALGSAWGAEEDRADVLAFAPDGSHPSVFATGLRNCVGLAVEPTTGDLWCSTNERDELGDDLVPDYMTRVRQGAFYGWPWYYIGDHEDPRLKGQRPDLRGRITIPDVLIQPHSASLQMTFYEGAAFPERFRGGFAAEHGSWNRERRTGYKVVRILLDGSGQPTGEYEDFLTGFVVDDDNVWGRPVGVAVTRDGALLVSEDGSGTVWRVSWEGSR